MGFIKKTLEDTFRAYWRDPSGKQRSKTFKRKKLATEFLNEVERAKARNTYVDPSAGQMPFAKLAEKWLEGYSVEPTTLATTESILRAHLLPRWGEYPVSRIAYLDVQAWVKSLDAKLAPATVRRVFVTFKRILKTGVLARIIVENPCDEVTLTTGKSERSGVFESESFRSLLEVLPSNYKLLPAVGGWCGLRWGEAAGLTKAAIDWRQRELRVFQVAVEAKGWVAIRNYPKNSPSRRSVPIPDSLFEILRATCSPSKSSTDLLCGAATGAPLRRSNFRKKVWRPALVRAGLLGEVFEVDHDRWEGVWSTSDGVKSEVFSRKKDAEMAVAEGEKGGLRFHDLRHSYGTWLISAGIPVNRVQRLMGHSQASTTLDIYTHVLRDDDDDVRDILGS